MVKVGTVGASGIWPLLQEDKKQASLQGFSQHLDGGVATIVERHLCFVMSQGAVFLSGNTNFVKK